MRSVFDELERRGFIAQVTHEDLRVLLERECLTLYVGFDPTADSLHVGHLLPIIGLGHFQRWGHRPLVLVGGATGLVGDPSGRSDERNLLTDEDVSRNAAALKSQMSSFLAFDGDNAAIMLDNNDWIGKMTFIDWLREVGKYFTVNQMIAKESIRARMESERGISFTEFSYMTMQAFDFLYLFDKRGCQLQCGGTDQWGNITAGIDLIRKVRGSVGYGLTFPLIQTTSGEKFGKSAGNAVWLDPKRTSVYDFYQYWMRTDDADVERFLKLFTYLPIEQLEETFAAHRQQPERREAQRLLAEEVTRLVHGDAAVHDTKRASEVMFGGSVGGLDDRQLESLFAEVPSSVIERARIMNGLSIIDLLCTTSVCQSRGDARRMIRQGAIYINQSRIQDEAAQITGEIIASRSVIVVRLGKRQYHLVRVVDSSPNNEQSS